ncbi:tRNA (adenosine(37)-N6)-threonylcarbamoyltransferase complex ATPase subunit type 1 TsaE [Candidatus Uhrbacteria bacterium CG_4_9_14_3_um_filter_41_35]|uniref:tRNA threonylcarbamoyladenosine biosynthesis protein TsaE n=1 Tax=Candidatus Uhrbacteria bacterium CG_4_9_14_3_um_filter_41_35 TaxID=1975034 RepID=A0A2M7XF08_9BACT|nr:MAG: tRNA (adenosine(37)-N6)-threonylcarbamoyltransferase complex ATPase subunit type 1 TsaE [Candidatus Uhrbacteria bacterium CG11_big_fil_rev_8_21_14_0_20_41_9]PJA46316.1 MAG: tRNA (adenosine(37)-N6)-threonylcarbamoyltransferase complex ATPase subunit type 1 TsaE [Candidatus Uhrbacteria bacterium CG_4_9_14_3_um_filter_41_35]
METHITHSEEATREVAEEFLSTLKGGEVIELVGDLGSGKTTFVRGLVQALGSTARVKSPTFTVMNEYPTQSEKIKLVVHLDLYRFKEAGQLEALAINDYIKPDSIIVIEWPDIFEEPVLRADRKVMFRHIDEATREIQFV